MVKLWDMVCSTYLEEIKKRIEDLQGRVGLDGRMLNDEQLSWSPGNSLWSIGQIFWHIHLINSLYFPAMEQAADRAKFGSSKDVRFSFFGKILAQMAGPNGNAPVPRRAVPAAGKYTHEVIDRFVEDQNKILDLISRSQDADLVATKVRNPFIPLLPMNLADCFEIIAGHEERHLGQIEQLMRRQDFPR